MNALAPQTGTAIRTSAQPTWAAARLRLGQSNVGFWVMAAAAWLWYQPAVATGSLAGQAAAWAALVVAYTVVQISFDIVGGYWLPVLFDRRESGFGRWLRQWARGAVTHGVVLFGIGTSAMVMTAQFGTLGGVAALAGIAMVLVAVQGWLARIVSQLRVVTPSREVEEVLVRLGLDPIRTWVVDAEDHSFVGGWYGPRGLERLVIAQRWVSTLDAEALDVVMRRRVIAKTSGARAQGVLGALAFNLTGLAAVLLAIPGASLGSVGGLLTVAAGTTLWGLLGVLLLPTLSRWAVRTLDRLTADAVGDSGKVARIIHRLDRDQEDELDRSFVNETFFHPVPAPAQRAMALRYPVPNVPTVIPWRVARMSLFMSWANLSMLARAVHCNIGRPDLWVMYPGD